MKENNSRRSFLKLAFGTLALAPLARVLAAMPKTQKIKDKMINEKTAKKLNYVDVASKAKDHKKYKKGSNCGNCKFYKESKEKGWGKCSMAGNKYVASEGWCKSYRLDKKKVKKEVKKEVKKKG